ncbi:hypothetical protein EVAR_21066_1 [Eumeta japonica]|uniref:Uncharacterized protein n=1 Tax=Eumeta variegata TaxID=151549 RepID=A0A4C1V195_EUMVA|nr:hypothetical protein EVAR_21066_1 [Eumeta japonica]
MHPLKPSPLRSGRCRRPSLQAAAGAAAVSTKSFTGMHVNARITTGRAALEPSTLNYLMLQTKLHMITQAVVQAPMSSDIFTPFLIRNPSWAISAGSRYRSP